MVLGIHAPDLNLTVLMFSFLMGMDNLIFIHCYLYNATFGIINPVHRSLYFFRFLCSMVEKKIRKLLNE